MGMKLEVGIFYCMCKKEISKARILWSLLLPLVLIGFITLIIGIIIDSPTIILLSLINIVGAIGDIIMTINILRMPDIKYLDLDDPIGFTLLSNEPLDNKKYFGLLIKEKGKYNKKLKAQDYTRLVISNPSKAIMVILILFILINCWLSR